MLVAGTFGLYTDDPTSLPGASGLTLGRKETTPNFNDEVMLVRANATDPLPDGALLAIDEDFIANLADSGTPALAVTSGVQDMVGAEVPINAYFWAKTRGRCNFLADNTVVDGDLVVAGSAGVATPGAAGNVEQRNILALEDNGGVGDAIIQGRIL